MSTLMSEIFLNDECETQSNIFGISSLASESKQLAYMGYLWKVLQEPSNYYVQGRENNRVEDLTISVTPLHFLIRLEEGGGRRGRSRATRPMSRSEVASVAPESGSFRFACAPAPPCSTHREQDTPCPSGMQKTVELAWAQQMLIIPAAGQESAAVTSTFSLFARTKQAPFCVPQGLHTNKTTLWASVAAFQTFNVSVRCRGSEEIYPD